jgi:hypothetical protein
MDKKYKEEEYLNMIVSELVNEKEKIEITRKVDDQGVLLTLQVAKDDIPVILGKEGNTAKSIRSLVRIVGYKLGYKVSIKINIPEKEYIKK